MDIIYIVLFPSVARLRGQGLLWVSSGAAALCCSPNMSPPAFLPTVFGTRVSPFPVDNIQRISHPHFPTAVILVEVSAAQHRKGPLAYFTACSVPEGMSGEISPLPEGQCQDTSISTASALSVLALNLHS